MIAPQADNQEGGNRGVGASPHKIGTSEGSEAGTEERWHPESPPRTYEVKICPAGGSSSP